MADFLMTGDPTPTTERSILVWPLLVEDVFHSENGPPKEDGINKLFNLYFDIVEEELLRDISSWLPTQIIAWDVTFQLVGKTMDDSLVGAPLEGYAVVYDMYGCILSFVFIKSESPTHWKQIMYNLRRRCEKFGGPDAANIAEYGYSDLGDKNVKDQKDHWFLKVWPAAKDAPFKDLFHAMKMVCGPNSVRGTSSNLHANFCRNLSSCVLRFEEESIRLAVGEYLVLYPAMNTQQARWSVTNESKWKKKMFNFTVPKEEAQHDCRLHWNKVKAEDARRSKAASKEAPYAPYILHQIKNKRRGGNYEMEHFIRILDGGGYQDPLPPREMSYPKNPPKKVDNKGLVDLGRFCSSSGGESTNKQINVAAKSATRLTADLGFKRVLIRPTRLNNDKDGAFEHFTGVKAKKPFWFLHEKIKNRATTCEYIESPTTVYPPELDGYKEPIGLEYARQKSFRISISCFTTMDQTRLLRSHLLLR